MSARSNPAAAQDDFFTAMLADSDPELADAIAANSIASRTRSS